MTVVKDRHRTGWMGVADGGRAARVRVDDAGAADALPTFDALFARYERPIYGYLLGMVGNGAQAQDLTQDTFLRAYEALPRTVDPALPVWLYRIATRTALAALRRRRRRLRWLPVALGAGGSGEERRADSAPDPPARRAAQEAVWRVLAPLTPRQRACLLLRAQEGLTIAEIAYVLDRSPRSIRVTLRRAKERPYKRG